MTLALRLVAYPFVLGVAAFLVITLTACERSCIERPQSEKAVKQAIRTFFNSGSEAARNIAAELRQDGMTDEYYERIKNGCEDCYARRGDESRAESAGSWYVITSIAPKEQKKAVVFEVECATSIFFERLYGG